MAKCWSPTSLMALALLGYLVGPEVEAQESTWQKPALHQMSKGPPPLQAQQDPQPQAKVTQYPQNRQSPQVQLPSPGIQYPQNRQSPQVQLPSPGIQYPQNRQSPQVQHPSPGIQYPQNQQNPQIQPWNDQFSQDPQTSPPMSKYPQNRQNPQVQLPSPKKTPGIQYPQNRQSPQVQNPSPGIQYPQNQQNPQIQPWNDQFSQDPQTSPPMSKYPQNRQNPQVQLPSTKKTPGIQYPQNRQSPQVQNPSPGIQYPQNQQNPQIQRWNDQFSQDPQTSPPMSKYPQNRQNPQVQLPSTKKTPGIQYPQNRQSPQFSGAPRAFATFQSSQNPQDPQTPQLQKPEKTDHPWTPQNPQKADRPSQTSEPMRPQSCDVERGQRVPCGPSDISSNDCQSIQCCFDGQQCYYGKMVTVQCTKDAQFIVVVARDATLPNLDLESISLLGEGQGCTHVASNSEFAIYQFPVTACGTTVTEAHDTIYYENRMSSSYEVGVGPLGAITRDSHFELIVRCGYHGFAFESVNAQVLQVSTVPAVAALGPISVQLRLANGQCQTKGCNEADVAYNSFFMEADYPVVKVLRRSVFVEVQLMDKTDPLLVLTLGRCWTTASPNPHSTPQWDLLIDGCPYTNDRYMSSLIPVDSSSGVPFPNHYRRFLFKMFTFVDMSTGAPMKELVYIHCSTAVFPAVPGRSTEPSCSRKARDVGAVDQRREEPQVEPKVVVSVGPVVITAAEEE
ncbi:zona pellucida sperm-binding protein 4-like isoform X3 [Scomber japonicus]|uniref:zona pellucida sperm-binding protein 4-like isoform X3 n=1 Tax=Scomber japonicus TaxID=13676 RepID=UPI0023063DEA|nr:zona pellucida sperm-binding protein 4-like isoform X3 [Scomber japonicus]